MDKTHHIQIAELKKSSVQGINIKAECDLCYVLLH